MVWIGASLLGLETSGWGPSIAAGNGALSVGLVNWSLKATISALELELEPQGWKWSFKAWIGASSLGLGLEPQG